MSSVPASPVPTTTPDPSVTTTPTPPPNGTTGGSSKDFYVRDDEGSDRNIDFYFTSRQALSDYCTKLDRTILNTMNQENVTICSQLSTIITNLENANTNLFAVWSGDASDVPKQHFGNVCEAVQRVYHSMSVTFATFLDNCSKIFDAIDGVQLSINTLNKTVKHTTYYDSNGNFVKDEANVRFTALNDAIEFQCDAINQDIINLLACLVDNTGSKVKLGIVGCLETGLGSYDMTQDYFQGFSLSSNTSNLPNNAPSSAPTNQPSSSNVTRVTSTDVENAFNGLTTSSSETETLAFVDVLITAYLQNAISSSEYQNYYTQLGSTVTSVDFGKFGYLTFGAGLYINTLNEFSKNPGYLGTDHTFLNVVEYSGSYQNAFDDLKVASTNEEKNFYALAAIEQLRKEVLAGSKTADDAKQAMKDMEQYCKLKKGINVRTALGHVWDAAKELFDEIENVRSSSK